MMEVKYNSSRRDTDKKKARNHPKDSIHDKIKMLSPPTSRLPSTQSMPFGVASTVIEPNEQQDKVELKEAYEKLDKYMDQFEQLEARLAQMEAQKD